MPPAMAAALLDLAQHPETGRADGAAAPASTSKPISTGPGWPTGWLTCWWSLPHSHDPRRSPPEDAQAPALPQQQSNAPQQSALPQPADIPETATASHSQAKPQNLPLALPEAEPIPAPAAESGVLSEGQRLEIQQRNRRYVQIDAVGVALGNASSPFLPVFLTRMGATNVQVGLLSSMPGVTGLILALVVGRFLQVRRNIIPWFSTARLLVISAYALTGLAPFLVPREQCSPGGLDHLGGCHPAADHGQRGILGGDELGRRARRSLRPDEPALVDPRLHHRHHRRPRRAGARPDRRAAQLPGGLPGALRGRADQLLLFQPHPTAGFPTAPTVWYWRGQRSPARLPGADPPRTGLHLLHPQALRISLGDHPGVLRCSRSTSSVSWMPPTPGSAWSATAQTAVLLVGYPLWARLSHRRGSRFVLLASTLVVALYPGLVALTHDQTLIIGLAAMAGIFQAGMDLVFFDELMKTIPPQYSPTFVSLAQSIQYLSAIVAPLLGTYLAAQTSIATALLISAALRLVGFVLFALPLGRKSNTCSPWALW